MEISKTVCLYLLQGYSSIIKKRFPFCISDDSTVDVLIRLNLQNRLKQTEGFHQYYT